MKIFRDRTHAILARTVFDDAIVRLEALGLTGDEKQQVADAAVKFAIAGRLDLLDDFYKIAATSRITNENIVQLAHRGVEIRIYPETLTLMTEQTR